MKRAFITISIIVCYFVPILYAFVKNPWLLLVLPIMGGLIYWYIKETKEIIDE